MDIHFIIYLWLSVKQKPHPAPQKAAAETKKLLPEKESPIPGPSFFGLRLRF